MSDLKRGCPSRAMVVAPKTLLEHWAKELRTCGLASKTHQYYAGTPRERCGLLACLPRSLSWPSGRLV